MTGPAEPRPEPPGRRSRWSKDASKFLLPHEFPPVVTTRRHWAVLFEPTAKALPFVVVGGWLLLLDRENRVTTTVGFRIIVGALLQLGVHVAEWWMRYFIVTNRRVLLTSGLIVRTVALLPLRRITDLTYKETLVGQLLGYGTFRFESAGQQQALSEITFLPRADLLYRDVSNLLFGGNGADMGDDEGNLDPRSRRKGRGGAGGGRARPIPWVRQRPRRAPRVAGPRGRQADR